MSEHSIGKTIASLRKSKGWTQVELAEKLTISDKAISKWESGAGLPEISQLPAMANLFNVTIDYLMTGMSPKKEIITISKSELCAKTDDIKLAKTVKDLPNDENNKNIVDYILQYQSINVFKNLCEIDPSFIERFKIIDAITLAIISNSLSLLCKKSFKIHGNCRFTFDDEDEIKSFFPVEDKAYFSECREKSALSLIPRDFFTILVTDKRINEATLDKLLSNQNGKKYVWYHAIPYMIDEAYKNGNIKLLHRIIDISKNNNSIAYENLKSAYIRKSDKYSDTLGLNHYFIYNKYNNESYGFVRILESTIISALENGDFKLANELNEINNGISLFIRSMFPNYPKSYFDCYIASEDEIRIAKLKLDKSVSETELQIQSAIQNRIININKLLTVNDFNAIKKALYAYPIHPFELLFKMYQQRRWRDLFEFSVDFAINGLSEAILQQNKENIEYSILECWKKDDQPNNPIKNLCINNDKLFTSKSNISHRVHNNKNQNNIQEVIDYLNSVRQYIINELSNKLNKEKIISELTRDYFYSELSKENKELVIIKLCVRMEAILKCDYHYQGDFSEMLDHFCNQFNTHDDEDNNFDPYTPALLNRLRYQRNSIVHSEKNADPISDDDIKQCIDYICSL